MGRSPGRPSADSNTPSRNTLLKLAFEEFSQKGFDAVSIRKLAKSIGVSDTLFNHHFKSKKKLWYEVVDTIMETEFQLLISQLQTEQGSENSLAVLRNYIAVMLDVATKKPTMFQLIFSELENNNERAEYVRNKYLRPYLKIIDQALSHCIERGEIRNISNVTLHTLVLGCVDISIKPAFALQGINTHKKTNPANSQELLDIIFNGLIPAS